MTNLPPSNSDSSHIHHHQQPLWEFKTNLSLSETRTMELQRASMKLSGCLEGPTAMRPHVLTEGSDSSDVTDDSELYNKLSKLIQGELLKKNFSDPAKALDEWACHLNSSQLLAATCILLKRMETPQVNVVHSLIKDSFEEPALFHNLTNIVPPEDEFHETKTVDFIDKLMSSLSFDPRTKASNSPYRNSMPITREFTLPKTFDDTLFDTQPTVTTSNTLESPSSRPKSFHEDNINQLLSTDWKTPKPKLEDRKESPLSNRIRPKSMYEPVMLNRAWQPESKEFGQHLPVGEADAVTWNIPLSPTVQTPRHSTAQISPSVYSPQSYSEELLSPGLRSSINHTPELYSQPETYNGSLHYRTAYHHPGHATRLPNYPTMPHHNGFSSVKPNWINPKDKPKRRSYGDHDIFPQGARNMFSNFPNTFRKHLMKPQNKVNFEILHDVPAWLRTLRLHKYTSLFEGMVWQDIIQLTDEDLCQKGISALGARRKMLKHFELVQQELAKNKSYHPTS